MIYIIMGQPINHDDIKDISDRMTKDSLKKGFFLALTLFIGFRLLSFFVMNAHP